MPLQLAKRRADINRRMKDRGYMESKVQLCSGLPMNLVKRTYRQSISPFEGFLGDAT